MSYDNPAEMSNLDLEKDAANNRSTATDGQLIKPETDENSKKVVRNNQHDNQERNADELVHTDTSDAEVHNGRLPDPEAIDHWETEDEDKNKLSG